jgi:hypothetical protein
MNSKMELTDLEKTILLDLAHHGPNTASTIAENTGHHSKSVVRSLSGGESHNSLSKRGLVCDKGAGVWTLTVSSWEIAKELDDSVKIPKTDTYTCDETGKIIYL